jgi:protein-tyrosine-phosphatase
MPTSAEKAEIDSEQKIDESMLQLLKRLNIDVTKLKDKQTAAKILNDLNMILTQTSTLSSPSPAHASSSVKGYTLSSLIDSL